MLQYLNAVLVGGVIFTFNEVVRPIVWKGKELPANSAEPLETLTPRGYS